MKSKNFTKSPALHNPALSFINTNAQEEVQDDVQEIIPHASVNTATSTIAIQDNTQEVVQEITTPTRIRTQGRKGCKKPRINMAFDELDLIKRRAAFENKSVTQFVNDVVGLYIRQHR